MVFSKIENSFLFKVKPVQKEEKLPRIYSYDVMRGIAVVFMILIHVMHVYAKPYVENSVLGYIIEFLGGPPAAPAFMMLMGIFFVYSNKGTTRRSIARGFNILLLSVALNLVRGVIPYYFLSEMKGLTEQTLGKYFALEYLIFEVDILTFAGISYMLMAVIYHYFKKPAVWLAIAVCTAVLSPLLWNIPTLSGPLGYAQNMLWGDEYLSTFPLFPWLVFPLVGMIIGRWLTEDTNHAQKINHLGLLSVFLMVAGGAMLVMDFDYFYHAYGEMGIGAITAIIGFVLFWQWLIYKLYNKLSGFLNTGFLLFLSKNVLLTYFIHWVLCKWGVYFFGVDSMGYLGIFIMFIAVTFLTSVLAWGYNRIMRRV